MKKCPSCASIHLDSLSSCPFDGALLEDASSTEPIHEDVPASLELDPILVRPRRRLRARRINPNSSSKSRVVLASLILGILLSLALAYFARRETRFQSAELRASAPEVSLSAMSIRPSPYSSAPRPDVSDSYESEDELLSASTSQTDKEAGRELSQNVTSRRETTIKRYPTVESPDSVSVDHEFAVQFFLSEQLLTPEVKILAGGSKQSNQLSFNLAEKDIWEIDVVVSAPDFQARDGVNSAKVILPKSGPSTPAMFVLRPKPILTAQQIAPLYFTLWHEGSYLARIVRDITIINPEVQGTNPLTTFQRHRSAESDSISLDATRAAPDLTIYSLDGLGSGNPGESLIIVNSRWQPVTSTPYSLKEGFSNWLQVQYSKFSQLSAQRSELKQQGERPSKPSYNEEANSLLRGFGRELYLKFAPPAFKDAFCQSAKNHGAEFRTIQIYSNNLSLPWELMRPVCPDVQGSEEHGFLGTEFAIGRWHVSEVEQIAELPPQLLAIDKLIVIAPKYEGASPIQQKEIEILKLIHGYERWPGQISDVKRLFGEFPGGVIYFAGHGTIATRQKIDEYSIQLEDGPLDLMTWRGMINRQSKNHPLLFFNACEIGQTQKIANFVDGWAPAVLEAGASGYIGALWPVSDQGAGEFGASFYESFERRLKRGPVSVAETLLETRKKFLENGDPTFLAYVYYGDARLKVRRKRDPPR